MTDNSVTLYPVFASVDLIIDIVTGSKASSPYALVTLEDIKIIEDAFQKYLDDNNITATFLIRHDFSGGGADFGTRVAKSNDVDVVIGASNLITKMAEGDAAMALYSGCELTAITLPISSTTRFAGVINTCSEGHFTLAQAFVAVVGAVVSGD